MFTSRLPKSTSRSNASTSSVGTNLPSSVRKPNLFTPQPKRSLPGALNSTSRKSYMTSEKKYQRPAKPAPDRDEQIRMFENLVDYMKMKDPSLIVPEAKRFFSSVSTTECSRIFEFLLSRLTRLKDFKITKLEIDVPETLAKLEYPYLRAVTKSALVSITTRQAIVNLLVIFDWLVKACRQADVDDIVPISDDEEVDPPILKWIFSDSLEPDDETRQKMDGRVTNDLGLEFEKVKGENERLNERLNELERYEMEEQAFVNDFRECARYTDQVKEYLSFQRQQKMSLHQEFLRLQDELLELEKKLDKLNPIVDLDQSACDEATLAHSMKKLEEVEKKCAEEGASFQPANIDLKRQELEFRKSRYNEQLEKLTLKEIKELESLRALERLYDETKEINTKRLKEYLDIYAEDLQSMIREEETDVVRLKKITQKVKENSKNARKASRKLKVKS